MNSTIKATKIHFEFIICIPKAVLHMFSFSALLCLTIIPLTPVLVDAIELTKSKMHCIVFSPLTTIIFAHFILECCCECLWRNTPDGTFHIMPMLDNVRTAGIVGLLLSSLHIKMQSLDTPLTLFDLGRTGLTRVTCPTMMRIRSNNDFASWQTLEKRPSTITLGTEPIPA